MQDELLKRYLSRRYSRTAREASLKYRQILEPTKGRFRNYESRFLHSLDRK